MEVAFELLEPDNTIDWLLPITLKEKLDHEKQSLNKNEVLTIISLRKRIKFSICLSVIGFFVMHMWYTAFSEDNTTLWYFFQMPAVAVILVLMLQMKEIISIDSFTTIVHIVIICTAFLLITVTDGARSPLVTVLAPCIAGSMISTKQVLFSCSLCIVVLSVLEYYEFALCLVPEKTLRVFNMFEFAISIALLIFTLSFRENETSKRLKVLEEAATLAEQASKSKSLFLATISHEMRTPLHHVFLSIDLVQKLLKEKLNDQTLTCSNRASFEKLKELINQSLVSSQFLMSLINDALDMSKIEAGQLDIVKEKAYIAKSFNDVVHMFESNAIEKNIDFRISFPSELACLSTHVDLMRLKQIISNLLSNAFKFTEDGGIVYATLGSTKTIGKKKLKKKKSVLSPTKSAPHLPSPGPSALRAPGQSGHVKTGSLDDRTKSNVIDGSMNYTLIPTKMTERSCNDNYEFFISVEDSGIGIAPEEINNLFIPFYQVTQSRTTRKYSGTGLGLSICKYLASEMNMALEVTSQVDKGTTFTLRFNGKLESTAKNITSKMQGSKKEKGRKSVSAPINKHFLRGVNVLICDDNIVSCKLMEQFVKKYGAKTKYVTGGKAALDALSVDASFDILLLDLYMPDIDGFEVGRRLLESKKNNRHSDLRIIALSATTVLEDKQSALKLDMEFLPKPFNNDELLTKISDCINKPKELSVSKKSLTDV